MIMPVQIRAARALLSLSQTRLAMLAKVGIATLKRIERADAPQGSAKTLWKLQTTLEAQGVQFLSADEEGGPGVRLKR